MSASRFDAMQKGNLANEVERLSRLNHELKRQNELLQEDSSELRKINSEQVPELLRTISKLENELRLREADSQARQSERRSISPYRGRETSPMNSRGYDSSEQIIQLKNSLRQKEIEVEGLKKEIENMRVVQGMVDNLSRKNDILIEGMHEVETELEQLSQENQQLKSKISQLQDENTRLSSILERKERETEELRMRNKEELAENRDKMAMLDKLNRKLLEQERLIEESQNQFNHFKLNAKKEVESLRSQLLEKEKSLSYLDGERRDAEEEKNRLIKNLNLQKSSLEEEIAHLQNQIHHKDTIYKEATSRINAKIAEIDNLRAENDELARAIERLESKIGIMDNDHNQRLEAINNHWETRMKAALEKELGEQFEQHEFERKQIEAEKAKVEINLSQAQNENDRLNHELKGLNQKLSDYENKITLLSLEIQRLNDLLEKKEAAFVELDNKHKNVLENFDASSKEWQNINQKIEEELAACKDKMSEYEEKIIVLLEENYKLGAENQHLDREIGGLKTQLRSHGITPLRFITENTGEVSGTFKFPNESFRMDTRYLHENQNNYNSPVIGPRDLPTNTQSIETKILSQNKTIMNLEEKIRMLEAERGYARGY